jgi:Tfp pilus assembly major pilin PilA
LINIHDDDDDDDDRYNDASGHDGFYRMEKEKLDLQFVTMIIHKYHHIISIINHILIVRVDRYNIRNRSSIMKMVLNETYIPIEKIIFSYQNNCHIDNSTATTKATNTSAINSSSTTATACAVDAAVKISYSCINTFVPFLLSITTSRSDDIPFYLAIYHLHCKVVTLHHYLTHSYQTYFNKGKKNISCQYDYSTIKYDYSTIKYD